MGISPLLLGVTSLAASVAILAPAGIAAQSGPVSERTSLGPPELTTSDEPIRNALESHRRLHAPPRFPSPPDGPDQPPDIGRDGPQCETSIAIDPLDEKHAVGVARDLEIGSGLTRWYTTFDGGVSWTTNVFRNEPSAYMNGDPTVVITPSGTPVVTLIQYGMAGGSGVCSYRSLDGGLTWQGAVVVDLDYANDKVQSAVDLSRGPYRGQIALAWDKFNWATSPETGTIFVAVSDDDGVSFHNVKRVDDKDDQYTLSPEVAYGPKSELWVMWADRGNSQIFLDKSTNGGLSFGTDIFVTQFVHVPTLPNSSFRIFDVFSIAADSTYGPYSGYVYILDHRWQSTAPKNASIYCIRSPDGGATWQKFNVNASDTTDADQVMPFAQVDPHGNVNVAFYDRRLDPGNYLLWTWVARSSDGGATWVEHPASDVGWDHKATDSAWFIGDYLGLDCSEHTVRPFFTDGRIRTLEVMSDELHLDLYTTPSELSAATGGTIDFTLNVGPNHSGQNYWLLGSLGTAPGLDFGSVHLPLNFDPLFQLTIEWSNSVVFQNSLGRLDSTGSAAIVLDSNGPFDPSFAGIDLFFAAYVWAANPVYGTNATKVSLVP